MSKRRLEATITGPNKRVHVCRKRSRDTQDVFTMNKRFKSEEEVLEEAEQAACSIVCATSQIEHLQHENAYLRHMLGKVARLGISLKAERDYLLTAQRTHVSTPHLITVP